MSCKDENCSMEKGHSSDSSCQSNSCCKGSGCEMTDMMIHLADHAWAELMKEKMKAHWEKNVGDKMDAKAAKIVEASMHAWQAKMQNKKQEMDYHRTIREIFMQ